MAGRGRPRPVDAGPTRRRRLRPRPSTGPTAAGSSSAAWTEGTSHDDDPVPLALPATTHSYLARAAESLQRGDHRPRRAHPLRLRPRRRAAGRRRPARRPGPPDARRGAAARRTPGCCWPRSPPSWRSGRRSSPPAPAKRAAAEAGSTRAVTEREADDLVRDADRFLGRGRAGPRAGPARPARRQLPLRDARGRRLIVPDPFVHLHVASGYSLQYGASHPHDAGRAGRRAGDGHPRAHRPRRHLRRGASSPRPACGPGSARCSASTWPTGPGAPPGAAQPVGTPVRGGASGARAGRSATGRLPRVTFLAGGRAGLGGAVPAGLGDPPGRRARPTGAPTSTCSPRLTSPARRRGGAARPGLRGRARPRPGAATTWPRAALAPWRELVPAANLLVELVSHRLPGAAGRLGPGTSPHAARMAGVARAGRARRGAHQRGALRRPPRRPDRRRPRRRPPAGPLAATCATLDRRQRRGVLEVRQADARGGRGDLPARRARATPPGRRAGCSPAPGRSPTGAPSTRARDLGLGEVHFPEFELRRRASPARPDRRRAAAGPVRGRRSATATARRPAAADLEAARRRAAR